jgi:hypothetical protein
MNIANDLGERGKVRLFTYSVEGGDGTWVSSPPERFYGLAYPPRTRLELPPSLLPVALH